MTGEEVDSMRRLAFRYIKRNVEQDKGEEVAAILGGFIDFVDEFRRLGKPENP